ncbi:MAG: SDR family NAD(P)-dependent oxidoreductase [Thermoanaerobaculum sp.]
MKPRIVLITGAASGIGFACAQAFLELGDEVVAHFRSDPKGLAELARRYPGRVRLVQADLGTEAGCVAVFAGLQQVDVLVHSAGIWNAGPIRQLSAAQLEEMFRVNTFSAYFLAREASFRMAQGSMVFIGSTAGERGEPGHSHYAGSKAALWGLVQSLAQELAPNIRVNLVSPGWVRTPMAEPALSEPGREERIVQAIPLRRIAEPEDVSSAVVFLADERQRHITGIDLPVSGGALLPLPRG